MTPLSRAADGMRTSLDRTRQADESLRKLLHKYHEKRLGVAFFAVGGFGRGDNVIRSDLDLIIIHRNWNPIHEEMVRVLIQGLWDEGWSPAQTILSIEEIKKELLVIPDRSSALLEARFLWGDPWVPSELEERINSQFDELTIREFIHSKFAEFEARRAKYGDVVRVVEPNLKFQAGGLRDIHHVYWLERGRAASRDQFQIRRQRNTAIRGFIGRMKHSNLLSDEEAEELLYSFDFLLRTREALRHVEKLDDDHLSVGRQPQVAGLLGFSGQERHRMREFMRRLYFAMEKISRFSDEFGTWQADKFLEKQQFKQVSQWQGISERSSRLYIDRQARWNIASSPEKLLKLIDYCVRHEVSLGGRTRHQLRREVQLKWQRSEPKIWGKALRSWIHLEEGFGKRIRALNELDANWLWLPEWMEINGLTMGSYYHRYTVDEHTLLAIDKLDSMPDDAPDDLPLSLWQNYSRKELVYLGLLFHDIGKGRSGDHSTEGAQMAQRALTRLGWHDLAMPVATLVRMHLKMEQMAFRRDASDAKMLTEFGSAIGSVELLQALYMLTVCDLRAVSSDVWTSWKSRLLAELYTATRKWFSGGRKQRKISISEEVARVAPKLGSDTDSRERAQRFISSMELEYRQSVPAQEIAIHLEMIESVESGEKWVWDIQLMDGFLVLTLVTYDKPGLLARVVGLLLSLGIGIREARIFTRDDGLVVDRFRAEDIEANGIPLNERLEKLKDKWSELVSGKASLSDMLDAYKRRQRLFTRNEDGLVETEVGVSPLENGYIIDISGPDRIGVLHRLCSVFTEEGLNVKVARVSGRIDGIHDSFLVDDPGKRLDSAASRVELIARLKKAALAD
ncbi:HD domain-containing protein [bacterium]|nr:HD domain-containing protein [bacterium]